MSNLDDDQENGDELAMVHVRNALEVGPGEKNEELNQHTRWKSFDVFHSFDLLFGTMFIPALSAGVISFRSDWQAFFS
jgi:hypothetical protein